MKRGEVWQVNLDPTIGGEIRNRSPCVIVNRDALARLPLRIIVPLTAWDARFAKAPWHVPIEADAGSGLSKKSSADTFQVRSISVRRLVNRIGVVPQASLAQIDRGLRLSLDLEN